MKNKIDILLEDGSYGIIGDNALYLVLKESNSDDEKELRKQLKKENPDAYKNYLEYEKLLNRYG
jgi:hypothetical protein